MTLAEMLDCALAVIRDRPGNYHEGSVATLIVADWLDEFAADLAIPRLVADTDRAAPDGTGAELAAALRREYPALYGRVLARDGSPVWSLTGGGYNWRVPAARQDT